MGVPAFFRWLSRKYSTIVVHCTEERSKECNGVRIPVDTSKPNPNEVEFDNLYLDMNGIIHPCTHPEDKAAPKNEDEMMVAIFEYMDRLFNIVRPRRVLYMAIDGVAPRAKMNQQRSRRFRASKEGVELVEEKSRIREEILGRGGYLPPDEIKERFDSNCITPGTEFMDNLAKCLRYYIADRLSNDPGWRNITVILSDASVPGEGEHKIMDYIRRQRGMSHLWSFSICGYWPFFLKHDEFADAMPTSEQEFIFIRLCVLREYLERELTMASLPFPFDFERTVDDWVFMCFFVGNDFLPHLPSLEIREGAIDRLVGIYKDVVHKTGGYITENGFVKLESVELIMQAIGVAEDNIFKKRKEDDVRLRRISRYVFLVCYLLTVFSVLYLVQAGTSDGQDGRGVKRKAEDSDSEPDPEDNVRLWEDGWKQRYYKTKFDVDATDDDFRKKVVMSYGCASWKWYFPFHYAPFASDFKDIKGMFTDFELGTKPFKPLEQLMGVFPAASGNFLPETWRSLMSNPESSIIDFYPDDFAIDLNGKKYAWQGVALLPFVDERRLRAALAEVYPNLSPEENKRNSLGSDMLFVGKSHSICDFIQELYRGESHEGTEMPAELCHGIQGILNLDRDPILPDKPVESPIPMLRDIAQNSAIGVKYKDPQFGETFVFKAVILHGAKIPAKVLKPGDWERGNRGRGNWRPQLGFNSNRQQVHLDQSAFRALGHSINRQQQGGGQYSNAPPPGNYHQGNYSRPPHSGGGHFSRKSS
uniref:5'-3' exoribonuclease n=1 Tax=Oncorhynchus tshawytscha TaxID=74940 RepID=A0AAZ3PX88_ONCTS